MVDTPDSLDLSGPLRKPANKSQGGNQQRCKSATLESRKNKPAIVRNKLESIGMVSFMDSRWLFPERLHLYD